MTNLLTLATQIEQATEDQQREMLIEAMKVLKPQWWTLNKPVEEIIDYTRWCTMLDAKAYESAAMMLVPEGLSFEVRRSGTGDKGQATIWNPMCVPGDPSEVRVVGCSTPALALAAACCRAVAQMGEQDHG